MTEQLKNMLWPFRRGNDDIFHTSHQKETIYDALGNLPRQDYEAELGSYVQAQWRKGFIQSVLPSACSGFVLGMFMGSHQTVYKNRHEPRATVVARYSFGIAGVGIVIAGWHHLMIVLNNYNDNAFFPLSSGMVGSTVLAASRGQSITSGGLSGFALGIAYTLTCWVKGYWQAHHLRTFLETQQIQQTPVHKVSPELQPLYRSYLFEFRPVEETSELKRRARLYTRNEYDTRLDAETMLGALTPEWYSWVSFPDWWPMKVYGHGDTNTMLVSQRRQDENFRRRYEKIITEDDGMMLKHTFRPQPHQEQGLGQWLRDKN